MGQIHTELYQQAIAEQQRAPAWTEKFNPNFPDCIAAELAEQARNLCSAAFVQGYATSGLGDAASDYQAAFAQYLSDHRAWEAAVLKRNAAIQQHEAWQQRLADYRDWQVAYGTWEGLMGQYQQCTAQWTGYNTLVGNVDRARDAISAEYAAARPAIEGNWGWTGKLPDASCVGSGNKAQYESLCASTTRSVEHVRGLGGEIQQPGTNTYYGTDSRGIPYCAWAMVPTCQTLPQYPNEPPPCPPNPGSAPKEPYKVGGEPTIPNVGPEPQPPSTPVGVMPACIHYDHRQEAIKMCGGTSGLRGLGALPEPFASNPCAAASLPVCPGTEPDAPKPEPDPTKRSNMMIGGILLLLVVGGGYGIYRSMKK
jgi:hypothetical protein